MKRSAALTALVSLCLALSSCGFFGTAGSVGIIGGTDGPTSIFIASRAKPGVLIPAIILVVIVIVGIVAYVRSRRKK